MNNTTKPITQTIYTFRVFIHIWGCLGKHYHTHLKQRQQFFHFLDALDSYLQYIIATHSLVLEKKLIIESCEIIWNCGLDCILPDTWFAQEISTCAIRAFILFDIIQHLNGLILCHFEVFHQKTWTIKIFIKYSGGSTFSLYDPVPVCKKKIENTVDFFFINSISQKNQWIILIDWMMIVPIKGVVN